MGTQDYTDCGGRVNYKAESNNRPEISLLVIFRTFKGEINPVPSLEHDKVSGGQGGADEGS
jgi:hypothetical protein